jgi:hypothetical protein
MESKYSQHRPTYWDRIVILASAGTSGGCSVAGPLRVIRVDLAEPRRLPVYPAERTFSG